MAQHVEAAPIAADVEAIKRLVENAVTHQSEVEPLMDLHTSDAIIVNVAGRRVLGRSAFRDAMQRALDTSLADVLTTVHVDDVRFVRPDVAIASCTKTIRDERDITAQAEATLPSVSNAASFSADTGHSSDTTSIADAVAPASARTWFHAVHRRRNVRQYDAPSSLAGSTASRALFIGTFTTMVSTNTPTT